MNAYDSARMADVLAPLGYVAVDSPETADMVILNTCHIREKASEKVFSELGRLRMLREARAETGGDLLIGVAGCVAQAEGAAMAERAPFVDVIVGPQTYHRLGDMVTLAEQRRPGLATRHGAGVVDTDFPVEPKFDHLPNQASAQGVTAFLTIQEGCDKFCTFCVVPYTRGSEQSRPVSEVIAEAERLADLGAVELTLLGQNVNAYHGRGEDGAVWGLGRLLRRLAEVPGLARLRYTTSHPLDMDDDLIAAHADTPAIMPFLHLPVQSGADRVLAAMNRRHTVADYRRIIDRLRAVRPDLALSSDFIVGFPGETEAEFEATLALVRDVTFAQAFSFKYSPRPGTPAANHVGAVPEPVREERLARLQSLLQEQQDAFNRATVGTIQPVLFEKPGRHPGQLVGRTPYLQPVHITLESEQLSNSAQHQAPPPLIGAVRNVRVLSHHAYSLGGELVESSPTPSLRSGGSRMTFLARTSA